MINARLGMKSVLNQAAYEEKLRILREIGAVDEKGDVIDGFGVLSSEKEHVPPKPGLHPPPDIQKGAKSSRRFTEAYLRGLLGLKDQANNKKRSR